MTPVMIQVLYWVIIKKRRTSPTTDVVLTGVLLPACRLSTGTGLVCANRWTWAPDSPAAR